MESLLESVALAVKYVYYFKERLYFFILRQWLGHSCFGHSCWFPLDMFTSEQCRVLKQLTWKPVGLSAAKRRAGDVLKTLTAHTYVKDEDVGKVIWFHP